MKNAINMLLGFGLIGGIIYFVYFVINSIFSWFSELDKTLAAPLITASSTIIIATLTVVLGKYFERIKEIESHHRAKKVEIYDEFLISTFNTFFDKDPDLDLVSFLQDWQRKIILWASPNVIKAFITWKTHLSISEPNAQSFFLMEDLFKAMRKDIGLSNRTLEKGTVCHLILKNSHLFLNEASKNPKLTLTEFGKLENLLSNKE
ncbi:hypothetical protein [Acinetobacter sp. HR7]|uniref:hypothetical protein n=1 Tax=Acinetobacter sp. HR7 TaxID=1509403 RepID=UPI00053771C9|nr:hypothetical protein [Acinetobacter sp. HR7]KGT48379.1 hypothetical protein GW12_06350 [Acinetobacter sp. HR7]